MTPQEFVAKWRPVALTERSASQQHFLDLCELLGQDKPAAADPEGTWYTFERGVSKTGGGDGWADVWMRGHFGWEYKGKHKDLVAAYAQLQRYREALENPPLLVVCDMDRFEVHTNFTGTVKKVYAFDLAGLTEPENLDVLRKLFTEPEALRPQQTTVGVTEAASGIFGQLADALRGRSIPAPQAEHFRDVSNFLRWPSACTLNGRFRKRSPLNAADAQCAKTRRSLCSTGERIDDCRAGFAHAGAGSHSQENRTGAGMAGRRHD